MMAGYFLYKILYNNFPQKLGLEVHFGISDDESDAKDDREKNNNIKEGGDDFNGKVVYPGVETVDLPGGVSTQGFAYNNYEEYIIPEIFVMSALPEEVSIYYILPEAMKLFHPKEDQNMVSAIKSRMFFCCGK